jgi:hypothetical protein
MLILVLVMFMLSKTNPSDSNSRISSKMVFVSGL